MGIVVKDLMKDFFKGIFNFKKILLPAHLCKLQQTNKFNVLYPEDNIRF